MPIRFATNTDIIDVVAALLSIHKSLAALRDAGALSPQQRESIMDLMTPILTRCESLLERANPGETDGRS